jgi:tetratricopeptide (TPR) repeat protein
MNVAKRFPCLSMSVSRTILLALPFVAVCQAAAEPTEILKLPDLTIHGAKELPPPEAWLYGRMDDGTEVLSNASERSSKRLLRDFQLFQQALEVVWPLPQAVPSPARTIILCGRQNKFDDFTVPDRRASDIGSTSLFLRDREQAAIVVDLQATTLNLSGLVDDEGTTTNNFEVDPYKQLYREYVRYQLSLDGNPPAWLQEGIAQIVMAMEFTPEWIVFGKIDSSAHRTPPLAAAESSDEEEESEASLTQTSVGDRPFNVALQRRAIIPLDKFFAVTRDAPEAKNPLGNNRWAKQAYAFVHLCLYGANGRFQKAFGQFLQRLGIEPVSEALFKDCFKMSYAEMQLQLRGYIGYTNHTYKIFKLKSGGRPLGGAPVALREATQAEVGRIKGDAQRLAGQQDRALDSYRVAYARGERDPTLLASLGMAENDTGQTDRAHSLLETAAKSDLSRPSAYVRLARLRLAAAKSKPAGDHSQLDERQLATVLDPLSKARKLQPALPETFETIAEALLASAPPPQPDQLAMLVQGIRRFPRDNPQLLRVAQLYLRIGDQATAHGLAQAGLRLATNEEAKARFEQFLASLPSTPETP